MFLWDALSVGMDDPRLLPTCDAWIALGLIAAATTSVTIGTMITPLSRRRPWIVAKAAATLDHLSDGRLVLPVGLGAVDDGAFSRVNEETDRVLRAQRLDEGLQILEGLWRGTGFTFEGEHYRVDDLSLLPRSAQSPRVPVWVVALWPRRKSMVRALRWDGVIPSVEHADGTRTDPGPQDVSEIRSYLVDNGRPELEIIVEIDTSDRATGDAAALAGDYADAGATWWLEPVWELMYKHPGEVEPLRRRIVQGPF